MTTTKLNVKTKLISIFLAIVLALSNCIFLQSIFTKKVFAQENQTAVSLNNSNFNNTTVSGSVITPTGWSKVNNQANVVSGVISLKQSIFEKQMKDSYKLNFKPYSYQSMQDEQILMLNAQNEKLNMGYQSENFTLNKNSYYLVSLKALTENSNSYVIASANLTNNDIFTDNKFSIVTGGNWNEYTFLIETSKIQNLETSLQLWLGFNNGVGSYGAVFFDDINIYELSQITYSTILNANASNSNYKFINLNQTLLGEQFNNNSFENSTLTDWEILSKDSNESNPNNYAGLINFNSNDYKALYKLDSKQVDANLANNNQALLINNQEASSIGFKSSSITIKAHHFYKISLLVKSNLVSGTATIKLDENNPYADVYDNFETKSFTLDANTTSATSAKSNDWIEYSFYIQGRSFEDTTLFLELWLGLNEKSTGYAMFDNILVYEINYNEYTAGISQTNATEANYASNSTLSIPNGKFNLVKTEDSADNYPYAPQNWINKSELNNETLSGVINTLDTSMIDRINNPTSGNSYSNNNNILMIGNLGSNNQTYTTESTFKLEANSYYKLSFKVQTQMLTNGTTAGFKLYTDTLTLKQLMFIESDGVWTTYRLLIKTGLNEYNCNVQLSLGSTNNGAGYAFFDDVVLSKTTEEVYNSDLKSTDYRVNLYLDDFTNTSDKKVNGLYSSNSFTANNASGTDSVVSGVVDVNSPDAMTGILTGMQNPLLPQGVTGNAIVIKSNQDAHYTLTSKESFNLKAGSYYKISVWVYTENLSQLENNKVATSNKTDFYPYGATIKLTNINKTFSGINTNGSWQQYIYYINSTDDANVQVVLSLGGDNALTSGTVFFSNLAVESIEQDDYYTAVEPLENDETINNIMAVGSTKVEPQTEEPNEEGVNFDWLVIPTLLTSIVLLLVLIVAFIKKFAKKHPRKIKLGTLAYNREITLEKEYEKILAIQKQREKLGEQLEQVKTEIYEAKQEFKKDEKEHKQKLEQEIKAQKDKKSKEEIKSYKLEQKRLFKQERLAKYKERQALLKAKYMAIEKEIEQIYQEELRLIKLYKEYKKQVKAKKKELKAEKKKSK